MATLEIAPRIVGRLIGVKGATIRQLKADYHIGIEIAQEDNAVKKIGIAL